MKLSRDEIIVILTWIPTGTTYLIGDIRGALIMLLGNVVGLLLYAGKETIRTHPKIMYLFKKIF